MYRKQTNWRTKYSAMPSHTQEDVLHGHFEAHFMPYCRLFLWQGSAVDNVRKWIILLELLLYFKLIQINLCFIRRKCGCFYFLSVKLEQDEWVVRKVFEKKLAYVFLRIFSSQTDPLTPMHFIQIKTLSRGGVACSFRQGAWDSNLKCMRQVPGQSFTPGATLFPKCPSRKMEL